MKRNGPSLERPYRAALQKYIEDGSAASLRPARRLGRRAVTLGLETLDLAVIHERVLVLVIESASTAASVSRDNIFKRSGIFFAETLLPLEATHHTAIEANARLRKLNGALGQRTRGLSATNRKLQKEIARRRAMEEYLRKSEERADSLLKQSYHLQEQLRLLSRRVLSAQENERKRVSRELHDVIAQILTGINVSLAALKTEAAADTKGLSRKIAYAQRLVKKSVDIVHRFARELRPAILDDLGLIPALHSFMKSFSKQTGIRVGFTAFAGVEKMSSAKRTTIYRVTQEALTNVARHAQASRVNVTIAELSRAVRVSIKDDGKSFDVDRVLRTKMSKHLGLLSMRERVEMVGGTFAVESSPGHGTMIQAQIPFNNSTKAFKNGIDHEFDKTN